MRPSPSLVVGKAKLVGGSWLPSIEEVDELLSELAFLRSCGIDDVGGDSVMTVTDAVLLYRYELSQTLAGKELSWPNLTT